MRRSIPAIPAARWCPRTARSSASTPPSSWGRKASALRSLPTPRISCSASWCGTPAQQFTLSRRRRHTAGLAQESAVMIATVEAGSPADRAGLVAGDIILALDGTAVTGADDLIRLLAGERIGRKVEVETLRGGELRRLSLVPGERAHRG